MNPLLWCEDEVSKKKKSMPRIIKLLWVLMLKFAFAQFDRDGVYDAMDGNLEKLQF